MPPDGSFPMKAHLESFMGHSVPNVSNSFRPKYVLQFIIQVEATAQFAPTTTTTVPDETKRDGTGEWIGFEIRSCYNQWETLWESGCRIGVASRALFNSVDSIMSRALPHSHPMKPPRSRSRAADWMRVFTN